APELVVHYHTSFDVVAGAQCAHDEIRGVLDGGEACDGIELDGGVGRPDAIDRQVFANALEHGAVEVDDALAGIDRRYRAELEPYILRVEARKPFEVGIAERGGIGS